MPVLFDIRRVLPPVIALVFSVAVAPLAIALAADQLVLRIGVIPGPVIIGLPALLALR